MWIASRHGFYSIVQKNQAWHVRARVKRDLLPVCAALGVAVDSIERWPLADYRWRIILTEHEQVLALFAWLASSITYNNFKNEIGRLPSQQAKLGPYGQLWASLAFIQQDK